MFVRKWPHRAQQAVLSPHDADQRLTAASSLHILYSFVGTFTLESLAFLNAGFTSIMQMSLRGHPLAVSKACDLLQQDHLDPCNYTCRVDLPWWCSTPDGGPVRRHHTCLSVLRRVKGHPKNPIGNPAQLKDGQFEPVLTCRRLDH